MFKKLRLLGGFFEIYESSAPMPNYVWYPVFAGLTLGFSFMNIPPVSGQFMHLFGVGYAGLSLLLSGIIWSHAIMQIPAGLMVDRWGVKRCVPVAGIGGMLFNIIPFFNPDSLPLAIGCRFGLGICTGIMFLSILKIIGSLAPADQMAKAQGFYGGSFGFGTMLPYFVLPYFGEAGWKFAYGLNGAMFAVVMALLVFLPKDRLAPQSAALGDAGNVRRVLGVIFSSGDVWMLGLIHGICYGTLNNLGQWLPSILADLAKSPPVAWGLATTLVLCLGSCSRSVSGYLVRFLSRAAILNGILVITFLLYSGMAAFSSPYLVFTLGLVLSIIVGFSYGSIFTIGARTLPPLYTGAALGLLNSIANLCNVGLTLLFGYVREHTDSFGPALFSVGVVALITVACLRAKMRRLDQRVE